MTSKNEKLLFFRNLKKNKLSYDQRFFHSIILSSANENVSNFLIFYFYANKRIYYHLFKTWLIKSLKIYITFVDITKII